MENTGNRYGGKCISSNLIYSVSGGGKTTQLGEAAIFIHKTQGKKFRLASASGGGWGPIQSLVDLGIVIPTFIVNRVNSWNTIDKLTKGWWPKDPDDPSSPLIPPTDQPDWDQIGGYGFESLTEISEWIMYKAVQEEAAGKKKFSAQAPAAKFMDGDAHYGVPAQHLYLVIQNHMAQWVAQSKALSGKYVFWTALENKSVDENTKQPVYGPAISGNAKTSIAPAWFDNVLHIHLEGRLKEGGKATKTRKMYTGIHFEENGIPYLAKNTASKYAPIPEFLTGNDLSMIRFFELLEESKEAAKAAITQGS